MKTIKLRPEIVSGNERISSAGVLRLVAANSPQKALSVDEMRRRVRILDALDNLPNDAESMHLEDEDVKTLIAAIDAFPWASANRHLLAIIDDVIKAEPKPPAMKVVSE
jgi:hypothetical protein